MIPLFFVLHFEPIAYPVFFWLFKKYDIYKGIASPYPDRGVYSTSWRSVAKILVYKIAICGWFAAILLKLNITLIALAIYVVMMGLFGFVHERIWNDKDYGIDAADNVKPKRLVAKAFTYRLVSSLTMFSLLKAMLGDVPWFALLVCQAAGFSLHLTLESLWSKNQWDVKNITMQH